MANSSSEPATAHAPARSKPPANTEHRCQQALFGVVEQVVGPLHRVAQRLMAFQSASRSDQQAEPVVEPIAHLGRQSSTAFATRPTRWPVGSRRGGGRSRRPRSSCVRCDEGWARQPDARSTNNAAALSRRRCDVQRRHRPKLFVGQPQALPAGGQESSRSSSGPRIASIMSAAASRTCSQLSNTSSRDRPSKAAAMLSAMLIPGCWVMPSTAATASGTAAGSPTAASSITHTPSGKSLADRAATSSASRVLPTPPTPVSVTSRCCLQRRLAARQVLPRGRSKLVVGAPQVSRCWIDGLQAAETRSRKPAA